MSNERFADRLRAKTAMYRQQHPQEMRSSKQDVPVVDVSFRLPRPSRRVHALLWLIRRLKVWQLRLEEKIVHKLCHTPNGQILIIADMTHEQLRTYQHTCGKRTYDDITKEFMFRSMEDPLQRAAEEAARRSRPLWKKILDVQE